MMIISSPTIHVHLCEFVAFNTFLAIWAIIPDTKFNNSTSEAAVKSYNYKIILHYTDYNTITLPVCAIWRQIWLTHSKMVDVDADKSSK